MQDYPYPESDAVRSIVVGILLSLITCGIYMLYWQGKQMAMLNAWLGRSEFSFWKWFFVSIITIGIYAIYYEYKMATGINEVRANSDMYVESGLPVVCVLLAIFGLGFASIAIQQSWINKIYKGM